MHRILQKIADWLIEKEEKSTESCEIPDEIIEKWLEILKERKKHLNKNSEEYFMIKDLIKKVEHIKKIKKEKNCKKK